MKLIVLNLPRDFEEQSLALLFKKIGDIKSCDLVIDKITGISKGFGFVEMALAHDGENAINKLCLLYTSPSPRDVEESRMPSSA